MRYSLVMLGLLAFACVTSGYDLEDQQENRRENTFFEGRGGHHEGKGGQHGGKGGQHGGKGGQHGGKGDHSGGEGGDHGGRTRPPISATNTTTATNTTAATNTTSTVTPGKRENIILRGRGGHHRGKAGGEGGHHGGRPRPSITATNTTAATNTSVTVAAGK